MFKTCKVIDKETGEIFETEIDTELENLEEYPYRKLNENEIQQLETENDRLKVNAEARKFLLDTDWKVIRHRDQLALGIPTSIDNDEFFELLNQRQEAREKVDKVEVKLIMEEKNVTG